MLRLSRNRALVALIIVFALVAASCGDGDVSDTTATTTGATTTTAAGATTTAPQVGEDVGEDIVIGMGAPITGSLADLGAQMMNASQYAVDEINAAGGVEIGGVRHKLRLEFGDTEGLNIARAVSAAQELIDQQNVSVLTGFPISSNVLAIAPIIEEAGVAFVSPVGKSTAIPAMIADENLQYIFQLSPTNDDLVAAHGAFLAADVKPEKVLFLLLNTDAGKDYGERATLKWPELMPGLETKTILVEPDTADLTPQLLEIIDFDPDVVYVLFVGSIVLTFVDQADAIGLGDGRIIFGDSDYAAPDFPEKTCGKTDNHLANAVTVNAPITDKTVPFFDGYTSEFGAAPPYYAVQQQDGMLMVIEALTRLDQWTGDLDTDRQAVQEALSSINESQPLTGVRGLQYFLPVDQGRKVVADIAITQFQDCASVLVWPKGSGAGTFIDPRS